MQLRTKGRLRRFFMRSRAGLARGVLITAKRPLNESASSGLTRRQVNRRAQLPLPAPLVSPERGGDGPDVNTADVEHDRRVVIFAHFRLAEDDSAELGCDVIAGVLA